MRHYEEAPYTRMWVVIYGNLYHGTQGVVGPFKSEEEAQEYIDGHHHNLGNFDKIIYEMDRPNVK